MKKYRFKYLPKEISHINDVFARHNVTLSFEELNNYLKALEEIAPIISESYNRYIQFLKSTISNSKWVKLIEYDTEDMSIISNGIGYPPAFIDYCPIKQVNEGITLVKELLNDYAEVKLESIANYGLMFSGDKQKNYEGCYYWINKDIFPNLREELKESFLQNLSISNNHIDFILSIVENKTILDYVGYNKHNEKSKYSFIIPTDVFLERNPQKHYKNLNNIIDVCEVVSKERIFDVVSFQLSPKSADYLALEIPLEKHELNDYIWEIFDRKVIDEKVLDNIINYNFNPSANFHYILKFRWDKNKFQVKIYSEEEVKKGSIPMELNLR